MSLPYDYARCNGVSRALQCEDCQRRTSPGRGEYQAYCAPELAFGICPNYIEPEGAPIPYEVTTEGKTVYDQIKDSMANVCGGRW